VTSQRVIGATLSRHLDLVPGLVVALHCGACESAHSNNWIMMIRARCASNEASRHSGYPILCSEATFK